MSTGFSERIIATPAALRRPDSSSNYDLSKLLSELVAGQFINKLDSHAPYEVIIRVAEQLESLFKCYDISDHEPAVTDTIEYFSAPLVKAISDALVAEGYAALASNQLSVAEVVGVHKELLADRYNGRSTALAMVASRKQFTQLTDGYVLARQPFVVGGSLRMVRGAKKPSDGTQPLEFMALLQGNWDQVLPHRLSGESDATAAELTRFTIPKDLRKSPFDLRMLMTLQIFDGAAQRAHNTGIKYLYAIMPLWVTNLLGEIPRMKINGPRLFNQADGDSHAEALALYNKYGGYWTTDLGLYVFDLSSYLQNRDSIREKLIIATQANMIKIGRVQIRRIN